MRVAGSLLTAGLVLGLVAAMTPTLGPVWQAGAADRLALIATREKAWVFSNSLFAVGLLAAVLGVAALMEQLLATDGGATSAWSMFTAFVVGTVLWLVHLGFRLTVMVTVSRDVGGGAPMPDWFGPMWDLGNYLLAAYVAIASIGLLFLGHAILSTSLFPGWSGWAVIGLGALFLLTLAVFRNTLPVLPHLATGLIGVLALRS